MPAKIQTKTEKKLSVTDNILDFPQVVRILDRTPRVLNSLMKGMPLDVLNRNEGGDSWSPMEILAHLIQGEREDWIRRVGIIINQIGDRRFEPFDMDGYRKYLDHHTVPEQLLNEFEALRRKNIWALYNFNVDDEKLQWKGVHPKLGEVSLSQLLATWACHDLTHLSQMARVLARGYTLQVGPWRANFSLLQN